MKKNIIAVLGSANIDLVIEMSRFPNPGETVTTKTFARYPGGKGANQAMAAARMGGEVSFYGKVGKDFFGSELLQSLRENGVNVEAVEQTQESPSGTTSIWVAGNGENAIAYAPGANALVDEAYVDSVLSGLMAAKIILLQFETPLKTISYLLHRLPQRNPLVILDPAPVQDISGLPLARVDIITPNRGELTALTSEEDVEKAAHKLLDLGVKRVICKDGENGSYLIDRNNFRHFASFPVDPVDTTAAGDAFNGTLAVALAEGRSIEEAIKWANAAGALATTRKGAQPSLPSLSEVKEILSKRGIET